ncbi:MAG: FAD:protein FMN transferase [Candidatus Dormibacteraceae bacterium]
MTTSGVEFPALGGTARVVVALPSRLDLAVTAVRHVVATIDATCSHFRSDSEVAVLNASGDRPIVVSPLLFAAAGAALRAAQLTDGAVDPTLGAPGWAAVELSRGARTIRLREGAQLDLGATAKSFAADLAAAAALRAGGAGVLVSLGGDIATAGEAPADGWIALVAEDHRGSLRDGGPRISFRSGGLATSSTTARVWTDGEPRQHRVLDPGTGDTVRGCWRTVTVAASSCLDANIAATAALVKGAPAAAWLATLGLPARLVAVDGQVWLAAGWPVAA